MSSNTNIGNTPVNQGYVQLIHTGETGGIDGTLRTLYDGDGTASDLQIASNKVKVSTELYIGSKTATEFIQDIVGDMFTTGSYTNITTTYDDTNGNIDLSASGEVTLTGTQTLSNKTLASPTFTGTANGANLTLTGDLTVSGDTIFTNSNTVLIGDAILTLNADETGSPTANAGFEVERGTSTNKSFVWNETDDKWTIGSETFVAGTVEANLTGNVTGSASLNLLKSNNLSDLASASTARTNLGVDAAGTDNSTDVTLAGTLDYLTLSGQQITRNAIDLTTDVTGTLPAGNGGTGLTSISTLLNSNVTPTSLGLVIGTDVQAQDTLLQDIADFSLSNPSQDGYLIAYSDAEPQLELVAPGISFNGSTANGLLTYGNSTTADVETDLVYNATGLGIGTTSPSNKLEAYGTDAGIVVHYQSNSRGGIHALSTQRIALSTTASADDLVFGYGGSPVTSAGFVERMRIDNSTGNVGIGTVSPESKLHIEGLAPTIILHDTDTSISNGQSYGAIQWHTADGSMPGTDDIGAEIKAIDTAGYGDRAAILFSTAENTTALTERMRIASGGNVGIGMSSNINERLNVYHSSSADVLGIVGVGSAASTNFANINFRNLYSSATGDSAIIGCDTGSTTDKGELVFSTSGGSMNATEKMRITSGGNVGIGVASPSYLLDVHGVGRIYSASGDADLRIEGGASNTTSFMIRNGAGNNRVDFLTGGANAMTINSSQNVGINATNPVEKLCVRSTATYATSIEYDASTRLRIGVAGSGVATFTTDNNAACAFTKDVVAYATSDKRLKDNIKPLDNALDKVLKISGVEFDWNDTRDENNKPLHSYKGHDVGVIAQEIEEVLPEVVTTRDNGYKAVKYEKIVPLLIQAIKEQQQQIEELKNG